MCSTNACEEAGAHIIMISSATEASKLHDADLCCHVGNMLVGIDSNLARSMHSGPALEIAHEFKKKFLRTLCEYSAVTFSILYLQ